MNNDNPPTIENPTTPEQELNRLLGELNKTTQPVAREIRAHLQGKPVDMSAARLQAMQQIDTIVEQIAPTVKTRKPQSFSPADLMDSYWDHVNNRREFATTGFGVLNRALSGGFNQDTLVVLLGAPGSGKTTFSNQVADHVASIKRPVLYITSEDTPFTLLAKTIANRGQIDYSDVLRGNKDQQGRINAAFKEYRETGYLQFLRYVDATQGISLDTIYELALAHFKQLEGEASGAPLLVVDYLQRLSRFENLGVDARQSATVYTERLRVMANDLHCTTLVLSAMNRASGYQAGHSALAAAKESGDIDYTADIIMAIGPKEGELEPAPGQRRWMLRIDKNRQGTTTYDKPLALNWFPSRQQFTEVKNDQTTELGSTPFVGSSNGRNGNGSRRR